MDQRAGTWRRGAIVWREAATSNLESTTAFYSALFGWHHQDSDMGPMGIYRQFMVGDETIAGCYQLGEEMAGVPPHWIQYLSVDDVDASANEVTANGGQITVGPFDIPGVGRVVHIQDPQGAAVALFRDSKGDGPGAEGRPAPGMFCWETLNTTDKAAAVQFYTALVGYQVLDFAGNLTLSRGPGVMDGVADVADVPPGVPSHWLSHVVVANLDQSRHRAVKLGATILMGEIVIPTVGRIAIIADPVGAALSLYEPAPPT